jgi:hypothetical protein
MVTGNPLTPTTVQVLRQTRVGSMTQRYIAPVNVDGATLFVNRTGDQVEEFLYTNLELAYEVTDLALVSRHILPTPVDMDFCQRDRLLYVVRDDGKFATLTDYRSEDVAAWTLHDTGGLARSVTVVGDDVYMLFSRNGIYTIEMFDDALNLDAALTGTASSPETHWSGLDHLNGMTVSIVADGIVRDDMVVSAGAVTLDDPASEVQIGLAYTHIIEPLPPSIIDMSGGVRAVRLVEATFRLESTAALRLDVGRGLKDVALRSLSGPSPLDAPPPLVSGDVRVRAFGWRSQLGDALWRIEQSLPLPFTLLAVTTEMSMNE